MFKIDSNQIVHRLKMVTNIEYWFPLHSKKGFFECFWALKSVLLYENGFKCGQIEYILKALICTVILTPIYISTIFFPTPWTQSVIQSTESLISVETFLEKGLTVYKDRNKKQGLNYQSEICISLYNSLWQSFWMVFDFSM